MIPIYIYCTKAKPYLLEDKIYHSGLHIVTPLFGWGGEKNGLIVARCEAKEAFVKYLGVEYVFWKNGVPLLCRFRRYYGTEQD
jgi:hypothetical protein